MQPLCAIIRGCDTSAYVSLSLSDVSIACTLPLFFVCSLDLAMVYFCLFCVLQSAVPHLYCLVVAGEYVYSMVQFSHCSVSACMFSASICTEEVKGMQKTN